VSMRPIPPELFVQIYIDCTYISMRVVYILWLQNSESGHSRIPACAKSVVILMPRGFFSEKNNSIVCCET
jgi:hypothetical protein